MGINREWWLPALIGAVSAAVLAAVMVPWGPVMNTDAMSYIAFGSAGRTVTGDPFLWWPPLYPLLIAAWTPVAIVVVAALSNAAVAVGSWQLARRGGLSDRASAAAGLLVGLALPTLWSGSAALTELLFTALAVWFCVALADDRIAAATALAGAAAVTRYTGVACIAVGLVVLASRRDRRWWWFVVGSSAPLAGWLLRNVVMYGSVTGDRTGSQVGFVENLGRALDTFATLAMIGLPAAVGVLWLVAALVVVRAGLLRVPMLWVGVYVAVVVAGATAVQMDPVGARLLFPVFPVLVVAAVVAASRARAELAVATVVGLLAAGQVGSHLVRPFWEWPRAGTSVVESLDEQLAECRAVSWSCVRESDNAPA